MRRISFLPVILFLITLLQPTKSESKPVEARQGMVVSVSAPGSDAGLAILQKGGNAVDAAVATAFALAVTYPAAGNIGGGGFMLIHPPGKEKPVVIDYRETAPAAASKTMFGKRDGLFGHKVVGVPGTVRGLALAHHRFGKLPWKDLILPAVKLAHDGFPIDGSLARSLNKILADAKGFAELQRVFGHKDGAWKEGDRLVQPDLAATLQRIADEGPDSFYSGKISEQIVAEMKAGNGLITAKDLAGYRAQERIPIHGRYRGYDVFGNPPPSSGGICLVEMLNILENFDLKKMGRWSGQTMHLMTEAMRRAYCDRARYLGDPAFTDIPADLTSKDYAKKLAGQIDLKHATSSADLAKDIPLAKESENTTHFSIIDKDGMAVANTYTLAPGKRMLSSQSPTIVAKDGKVLLVTGSPGSRTIINTVLCIVVNILDFDMPIDEAVAAPRHHHQWFPDEIRFEGAKDYPALVTTLNDMGHRVVWTKQGDAHSILVDRKTGAYLGAADRRISGKAAGY